MSKSQVKPGDRFLFVGIHGWNTKGFYMRYFEHYSKTTPFYAWRYGWIFAKSAKNDDIADRLVHFLRFMRAHGHYDKFVLFGHSNGCELAWRVARRNDHVVGIVNNNAALDAKTLYPETLHFVHNWFTRTDYTVKLAKLIPFNKWGDLGSREYQGISPMVVDFDKSKEPFLSRGHSDTFSDDKLRGHYLPLQVKEAEVAVQQAMMAGALPQV